MNLVSVLRVPTSASARSLHHSRPPPLLRWLYTFTIYPSRPAQRSTAQHATSLTYEVVFPHLSWVRILVLCTVSHRDLAYCLFHKPILIFFVSFLVRFCKANVMWMSQKSHKAFVIHSFFSFTLLLFLIEHYSFWISLMFDQVFFQTFFSQTLLPIITY